MNSARIWKNILNRLNTCVHSKFNPAESDNTNKSETTLSCSIIWIRIKFWINGNSAKPAFVIGGRGWIEFFKFKPFSVINNCNIYIYIYIYIYILQDKLSSSWAHHYSTLLETTDRIQLILIDLIQKHHWNYFVQSDSIGATLVKPTTLIGFN